MKIAFFTNLEELSYFLNTLSNQAKTSDRKGLDILNTWNDQAGDLASNLAVQIIESNLNDKVLAILALLNEPKRKVEILEKINLSNQAKNRERYLGPLVKLG